ncbi:Fc.00g105990.m01.CDS01 [Cosmosporella sp. VM-42]
MTVAPVLTDDNVGARLAAHIAAETGTVRIPQQDDDDEHSRDGMFTVWQRVIYAAEEGAFGEAWLPIMTVFGTHQWKIQDSENHGRN